MKKLTVFIPQSKTNLIKPVVANFAPVQSLPNGKGNRLRKFEQTKKPAIGVSMRSTHLINAIDKFKSLRISRTENFPTIQAISMQDNHANRKSQTEFNSWLAEEIARIKTQNAELEAQVNLYSDDWHLSADKMNTDQIFNEEFSNFDQEFDAFPKLYCRVSGLPLAVLTPSAIKTALIYYPFLTLETIEELFASCGNIHPAFYFTHAKAWHIMRKLDAISAITAIYGLNFKADMRIASVQKLRAFFTELKNSIEPTEFNVLIDLLTDMQKINYKWLTIFNDKNELQEQLNSCRIDMSVFNSREALNKWLVSFKHLINIIVRLTIKHKITLSNGVSPPDRLHIESCLDKYGAKNLKALKPLEGDANIIKRVIGVYFREFTSYTQNLTDDELIKLVKNAKLLESRTELAFLNGKKPQAPDSFIKLKQEDEGQALFNRLLSEINFE